MRDRILPGLPLLKATVAVLVLLASFTGCFFYPQPYISLEISGHVRRDSDSTSVHGAYIIVSAGGSSGDTYTSGNGFYNYSGTISADGGDPLAVRVTVIDVDGPQGGVFVSRDTLMYWENTEGIRSLSVNLDLYVHIVAVGLVP